VNMAASPGSPPLKKSRTDGAAAPSFDIDDIIDKLVLVRKRHPSGQSVYHPQDTVAAICKQVREIFMSQDMLLDLQAPLKVCGDIHGQYHDLLRIFDHVGFPPKANYLFLGDYVDRGKKSLETIILLFAYKIKYPENFFLLRGNHESPSICRIYGFYDECKRRYNVKMWRMFLDVFNCLPVCARIDDRVLCMHGGLSQEMLVEGNDCNSLVDSLTRPADIPDSGFLCDLLWADPMVEGSGFGPNDRGVSVSFGADVLGDILAKENLDLVVRAHQVVEDGYEFFGNRSLVTIFSAPNYCGEFDNAAAVLSINEKLQCSFQVLKPALQN